MHQAVPKRGFVGLVRFGAGLPTCLRSQHRHDHGHDHDHDHGHYHDHGLPKQSHGPATGCELVVEFTVKFNPNSPSSLALIPMWEMAHGLVIGKVQHDAGLLGRQA